MTQQLDKSNDPHYKGIFWCYEAQQYFRWEEMMAWYEEQKELAAEEEIRGAPL